MKNKLMAVSLALCLFISASPLTTFADSANVVSLGANLTKEQRDMMLSYFNVKESEVAVIEVNNQEEREYLEDVATEQQIGKRTFSCAYIEETEKGSGINVKTANLTWVTPNIIKSTLTTAGIYDCNVIAAAPFAVSGTGALTGIMKAFETITGAPLEDDKKELATEEIVISGTLADDIGADQAAGIITDVKDSIVSQNVVNADDIETIIINSGNKFEVTLTDEQVEMILGTMTKYAKQDYDYDQLKETFGSIKDSISDKLDLNLSESSKGFFESILNFFRSIFDWFVGLFGGNDSADVPEAGILEETDDSILGDDVLIDSTIESTEPTKEPLKSEESVVPEETQTPSIEPSILPEEQDDDLEEEGTVMEETVTPSSTEEPETDDLDDTEDDEDDLEELTTPTVTPEVTE